MLENHKLLGIFAHPDDEILAPGGAVAQYASQGVHVEWICATRGEAGEIADSSLATPATIGQVRQQEMLCAAETLGIHKVHFLGYRDSGMDGTEDNQHPQAFVNAAEEEVVPRLVALIRQIRPSVILTFEPFGGYGHPDHITIHHHTHAALTAAAKPDYRPDLGDPWATPRLFYPLLRLAFFDALKERMAARELDLSFFDRLDERREKGWPDEKWHCRIDIRHTFARKWIAFHCHATQFGPDNLFRQLPEAEIAEIFTHEYFALAHPKPAPNLQLNGLFDSLH